MNYTYCERLMAVGIAPVFLVLGRSWDGHCGSSSLKTYRNLSRTRTRSEDVKARPELSGNIRQRGPAAIFAGKVLLFMRSCLRLGAKPRLHLHCRLNISEQRLHLWRMQIGTPFSGMPRSPAGCRGTTPRVRLCPAPRPSSGIYARTRCQTTLGGSTVPKRWLLAVTAVL